MFSVKYLQEQLSSKERITYHYRSIPNPELHEFFETQAVKIYRDEQHFYVLVGFRHIDEIMEKETAIQNQLKQALDEVRLNNEIISAIGKNYCSIYRIDVRNDYFDEISNDDETHRLTGNKGCASEKLYQICDTLIAPEYRPLIRPFLNISALSERLKNEEYISTEYRMCDGNWHKLRFIAKKRDGAGNVTHVLCTVRSIGDSKRREENLSFEVEAAKQEADIKTRFLATMSHDIRTPLNGIIGMINMADQYADDLKMQQKIREKAMESLKYLVSLVNDVLDMNKLQSGELKNQELTFDLVETLQELNKIYKQKAAEKQIQYCVELDGDYLQHPFLTGNPVYLGRILSNIADNAIKFSLPESTITVCVKEEKQDAVSNIISKTENYDDISVEGIRALVVEDNEMNMEIARCMLEDSGMEVISAVDGQEAVEIFENSAPGYFGVIYMDIMMPRMNGLEATRAIRAMNRRDAGMIPIIAVSANAFAEDVINSRLAGVNIHLAKPLDINKMIHALKQCMADNGDIKLRDDL